MRQISSEEWMMLTLYPGQVVLGVVVCIIVRQDVQNFRIQVNQRLLHMET